MEINFDWTQVSKSLWQMINHPAYCVIFQLQQGNVKPDMALQNKKQVVEF